MQSNMNVTMVWAWMLWSSDAVKHERYYGWAWNSGHPMQSKMNATMDWAWMLRTIWAWMLWSSDADEHECYNGLGMDALVIGCSPT